ncbi:MAG: hypothetical protein NTX91_03290 [candidate division SR1 bacterium]|nr:hypothetical protein [candidate division SR1 bacterium]
MIKSDINTIQFPKTPGKNQFVNFLKPKFKQEDLPVENKRSESEIRHIMAEKIYDIFFLNRMNVQSDGIAAIVMNGSDILDEIKKGYPDLESFIKKLQGAVSKNLFLNDDFTQRAKIAKDKGLEPFADMLAENTLSEEEIITEAEKFKKWDPEDLNKCVQEVEEAIQGARDILSMRVVEDEYPPEKQEILMQLPGIKERLEVIDIRDHIIACQNGALFDVLSREIDDMNNKMIWEPFLSYIEGKFGHQDVKYIENNFEIDKEQYPKIILKTDKDANYTIFEEKYVRIFYAFVSTLGRRFGGYSITNIKKDNTNSQGLNTTKKQEREGRLTAKTHLQYNRENFIGDKIKTEIKDLIFKGKNIYIEGGTGSGKSHVLQGLAKELHQIKPQEDILYMTGMDFYNEYQKYATDNRKEAAEAEKEKTGEKGKTGIQPKNTNKSKKEKDKEYKPSFIDQFFGKIVIIDGIDPIFTGKKIRSKETFITAATAAKQVIFSGRRPIGEMEIPREGGIVKISSEINLSLVDMPAQQPENNKRAIIKNMLIEMGDLFTQTLPIDGITNILLDHVPASDYRMIIEGYLRTRNINEGDPLSIKEYIEKKLSKKDGLKLPIDDIIKNVYEILVCDEEIRKSMPGIIWSEIDNYTPEELMKKMADYVKGDSALGLFMELVIYFIMNANPELTQIEIGKMIGKPASIGSISRATRDRRNASPRIFQRIESGLTAALYKKYGLEPPK